MSRRIKPKREICAHFNEGNLAQFRRSAKNKKNSWRYLVVLKLVGRK